MHLRCKEGDLALVIHDEESCKANIGKLVRVAGPVEYNMRLNQHCWLIEPVHQELWWCVSVKGLPYQKVVTFTSETEHPDGWLLPIDPNLWDLDETNEENLLDEPQKLTRGVSA